MSSLRWKLGGVLLLIVAISVGLAAYLANLMTGNEFNQYLSVSNNAYIQNALNKLADYYEDSSSWDGVEIVSNTLDGGMIGRLVIADASGLIVGDTDGKLLGQSAGSAGLESGFAVEVDGDQVGTVYLYTSGGNSVSMGKGRMGGNSVTNASAIVGDAEEEFLSRINTSLIISGLIAGAVALILGLIVTRQITKPIISLNRGAGEISRGNLNYRVNVNSGDEIGKLADSFNKMAVNLEKGENDRRRIIADITHELRTPLTIINGTVDAIKDGVFQPDEANLNSITEQTKLLEQLVSDLRDLSLVDSGQLKLEKVPADIVKLLRRKITGLELRAQEKNIGISLEPGDNIPEIIVDPLRIEQVVGNLITNAIRHTKEGGKITVSVKNNNTPEKAGVLISVADNGEGIAADELPNIFERFYRVEKSRSRTEGGVGLGLAIVKQLVEAHGGKVWAESELGKGSTFYVAL